VHIGSLDDKLYALNADGSLKWEHTLGADVLGSPSVGADGTVYVGSLAGKLRAVSANGGKKWEFDAVDAVRSRPAIGADGTVYFGADGKQAYAVGP
jgi:outer membrane protein assembly factor BamB